MNNFNVLEMKMIFDSKKKDENNKILTYNSSKRNVKITSRKVF